MKSNIIEWLEKYGKNNFKINVSDELVKLRNDQNTNNQSNSIGCLVKISQNTAIDLNLNGDKSTSNLMADVSPNENAAITDENNNIVNSIQNFSKQNCSLI